MNNIVEKMDSQLNSILNDFMRKPTIIRGMVHLLLILYAARLAPTPPKAILKLFDNIYFKLAIFSLVLWTAQFSPSTSILIALAFMVTINYTTTGKVWEMMDNIGTSEQPMTDLLTAIDAVKVLSEAAASEEATSPTIIAPIANLAASSATTIEGVNAIKALAEQAVTPEAGTKQNITMAVTSAVESIQPTQTPQTSQEISITKEQSIDAIKALAVAASSETAIPTKDIIPVLEIALVNTTTNEGTESIKALAQQAATAEAGTSENVTDAASTAINSILKTESAPSDTKPALAQQSGCFPVRQYDMTKVLPQTDGKFSFEDYQQFTATPQ